MTTRVIVQNDADSPHEVQVWPMGLTHLGPPIRLKPGQSHCEHLSDQVHIEVRELKEK